MSRITAFHPPHRLLIPPTIICSQLERAQVDAYNLKQGATMNATQDECCDVMLLKRTLCEETEHRGTTTHL